MVQSDNAAETCMQVNRDYSEEELGQIVRGASLNSPYNTHQRYQRYQRYQ